MVSGIIAVVILLLNGAVVGSVLTRARLQRKEAAPPPSDEAREIIMGMYSRICFAEKFTPENRVIGSQDLVINGRDFRLTLTRAQDIALSGSNQDAE